MSKYNAKKIHTNEGVFDSVAEYNYWKRLNAFKSDTANANPIESITRQQTYKLTVNGVLIGKYIADFVVKYKDGSEEVIDYKNPYLLGKGKGTPAGALFQYKKKLMKAIHNIEIKIVTNESTKNRKG